MSVAAAAAKDLATGWSDWRLTKTQSTRCSEWCCTSWDSRSGNYCCESGAGVGDVREAGGAHWWQHAKSVAIAAAVVAVHS